MGLLVKPSALFEPTHNGLQHRKTSRCAVNTVTNSTVFGANETQTVSEVYNTYIINQQDATLAVAVVVVFLALQPIGIVFSQPGSRL